MVVVDERYLHNHDLVDQHSDVLRRKKRKENKLKLSTNPKADVIITKKFEYELWISYISSDHHVKKTSKTSKRLV